jgi:CrcB protein
MTWLAIGLGGAIGAMARHALGQYVMRRLGSTGFPYGTVIVNLAGCLAIGVFAGAAAGGRLSGAPALRSFVVIGVLGGFTTFSAFGLDTLTLLQEGRSPAAAANVAVQVGLGLLAVWAGFAAASR